MAYDKDSGKKEKAGFKRKARKCYFCMNDINYVDYKDTRTLKKFVSDKGKILPRRITGTCAKHQRMVAEAIKRSREAALIPYTKD
ncbi:MAG: 30S ribosomal protein S18 [Mesoaciditoga sp.]|uniref:30S ribosomal protein S18 n=1 Tax=Athalassotoga sp. TaxID=2022597 RepID=UPI000CBA6F5A|nr:MAG: 30S ribosomal protein S18 [Mesoaciditoga sp.]PMP80657.1 MAG: 30S ribosomal protein S18 [Mesoaciditoga sp.]HEU24108.1 30S ribosomal protein S18 [Mesoaciditoga lauensis]